MKNVRRLVLSIALVLGMGTMAMAQKIAHIDSQKLLTDMPEMKSAQAQIQKLEQTYTNDIQASLKEYQAKAQAFQNEINALTEEQLRARQAEFEKRGRELETIQNNIRQAQENAANELQKKRENLVAPLLEKAKKAVEKVAQAQGYEYVVDAAQGSGVIVAKGKDLYNDVKRELGF